MKRIGLEDLADMVANGRLHVLCKHCPYCNKISYPSENDAKQAAREQVQLGKGHLWVYQCPKGDSWHLTSVRPQTGALTPKQKKKSRSSRKRPDRHFYRSNGY